MTKNQAEIPTKSRQKVDKLAQDMNNWLYKISFGNASNSVLFLVSFSISVSSQVFMVSFSLVSRFVGVAEIIVPSTWWFHLHAVSVVRSSCSIGLGL